jgi:nucleoside-diphosphate-sugar epimerase
MPQYIAELIRTCLDGRPYRLPRGTDQRFHFVRVEDVAAATAGALNSTRLQQCVYNATGGSQITFARAAELVREPVPQARIRIGPGALESDQLGPFDISAAGCDLGYQPGSSVEQGISDYVARLRAHDF